MVLKLKPRENRSDDMLLNFLQSKKLSTGRSIGASLVAQSVKNLLAVQDTRVQSLGQEDPLKEPGGIQPMGSQELDMT